MVGKLLIILGFFCLFPVSLAIITDTMVEYDDEIDLKKIAPLDSFIINYMLWLLLTQGLLFIIIGLYKKQPEELNSSKQQNGN